jgi:hypothetical protein
MDSLRSSIEVAFVYRSRDTRCAPRSAAVLTSSTFLEPPAPFSPTWLGWSGFLRRLVDRCVDGPPRSPLLTGASLATDHSGNAVRSWRRSPFRAEVHVPSTPAGIPVGCAPCGLSRSSAWCRSARRATRGLAVLTTVALDTDPHTGPDANGHTPLDARARQVGRAWLVL